MADNDVGRYSDIIDIFDARKVGAMALDYMPERSAFSQAGIYALDTEYNSLISGTNAFTYQMYFWGFKSYESTPVTDTDDEIQPHGLSSDTTTAVAHYNALSYGVMNVIREVSMLADPLRQIAQFDATVWSNEMDRYALGAASTAITVANTAVPNRYLMTLATEDGANANDAQRLSPEATLDALHMSGRGWSDYSAVAMTHRVYLHLQKNNLIDVVEDSAQNVRFSTYLGLRVVLVEDEYLDRAGTTSGTVSRVIFFRPGAIPLGMAKPSSVAPSVFVTNEKAGMGSAKTEWITRQKFIIGMRGVDWGASLNHFPSYAEFTTVANWTMNSTWAAEQRDLGMLALDVNI